MEIAFIRPKNITLDRHVFFLRKQKKDVTVEQFQNVLKELAENCDFKNCEELIIRYIFITNMLDDDIQRELLRVEPWKTLSIAVNMEWGHQNQQRISSNNNNVNSSAINAIQQFSGFCAAKVWMNQSIRNTFNRAATGLRWVCGQIWTSTHRQVFRALCKECNHCALLNLFAKVYRKKLNNTKNSRRGTRINKVELCETAEPSESQNV